MTRKEFVTKATENLAGQYSPGEAKAISIRILSHFLGLSEYEYSVEPNVIIPKPDLVRIQGALDELAADRPVQYVIGEETSRVIPSASMSQFSFHVPRPPSSAVSSSPPCVPPGKCTSPAYWMPGLARGA